MERLRQTPEMLLQPREGLYVVSLNDFREQIVGTIRKAKLSAEYVDEGGDWVTYWTEGKMVGCVTTERRGKLVHLQSLSVDPAYRRRGIAREMVDYVFEYYVDNGEALTALTLFWNIKIYERLGFMKVDAAEMKKMDDVAGREKHKHCAALVKLKE